MTRSIRPGTGCCVLSALFAIALAGCGSSSTGPAPLTTTPDASALPDAIGVADTMPGPVAIADAASSPGDSALVVNPDRARDSGAFEASGAADNAQPGMLCPIDSDCGNSFLTCLRQVATMCRDPNSVSVDAGGETSSGNVPADLPLCPTQTQVTANLCSVRYQLPCQVDSDCGPDGFTCNTGQCSQKALVACNGDGECPQGWSCYSACQCGNAVGVKYCYPPFAEFWCPMCLVSIVDGG
jgi:hypothetical protein